MSRLVIPAEVEGFLREHIRSLHELEILLLLFESAPKEWDVAAVADRLRVVRWAASERLDELSKRGLLVSTASALPSYRYSGGADLDGVLRDVAKVYSESRVSVIELILSS